jgi:hypothetical protein
MPDRQVPAPSQKRGATVESPLQVRGAHGVVLDHIRHAPRPSQEPSRPQLERDCAAHSLSGSVPAGMGRHRPRAPGSAHDRYGALQAVEQHTPFSHKPDAHSPALAQVLPRADFMLHWLKLQVAPGAQPPDAVQVVSQAMPSQA